LAVAVPDPVLVGVKVVVPQPVYCRVTLAKVPKANVGRDSEMASLTSMSRGEVKPKATCDCMPA
jgi:hypothetical protein